MTFDEAVEIYKQGNTQKLQRTEEGLYFLKLRSLSRKEHLKLLADNAGIDIANQSARFAFRHIYEKRVPLKIIHKTIKEIYNSNRTERKSREDQLVNELYKLKAFDWGGLHQNNLEKTIINNYVKKISSFKELNDKIEGDLHKSLRGYTLCSWYNHWTSIIIEDIYKDHPKILPSVGLVKQIDFFINDVPFDLKVTYLPEGYIKGRRKKDGLKPELTILKACARNHQIPYCRGESEKFLLEDLWQKTSDSDKRDCIQTINQLTYYRNKLIDDILSDSKDLIRWLYENQGTRRFDSSNRFFLVLINKKNYFESWKLKRMRDLLKSKINDYLNSVDKAVGKTITFSFNGEFYKTQAEALIVVKE